MAEKTVKKRNWSFVLYPESAPKDWLDILQGTGLAGVVSPIHDRDKEATGEPKKAHYHVILCYPGPTTYNAVKSLTVGELGQTIPKPVESVKGYYRYLTHKDSPDKAQYDEADIVTFNGFSIVEELSRAEVGEIKRKIQDIIVGNSITEYAQLMDLLRNEEMIMEYDVASTNTIFFNNYITSRRHMLEGGNK